MLTDGMIPANSTCPFRGQCYFTGTACPIGGSRQHGGVSCSMARLFDAAYESGEMTIRRS